MEGRADRFDDLLNESYPEYTIAGITLTPAQILFDCDPIAYRIALSEYEDSQDEWEVYLAS
jgi:hypothetical protein